jgi:hypothetical protein
MKAVLPLESRLELSILTIFWAHPICGNIHRRR